MFLNEVYRKQRSIMSWLSLRHVSRLLLTRVGYAPPSPQLIRLLCWLICQVFHS